MVTKRGHIDLDPDYEDVTERQSKRQRVMVEDAKEATRKKIQAIITEQFDQEIYNKETEIDEVDQQLHHVRLMMDRLRACIVANYYGSAGQQRFSKANVNQPPTIHPTVKNLSGKRPRETLVKTEATPSNTMSAMEKTPIMPLSSFLGKIKCETSHERVKSTNINQSESRTENVSLTDQSHHRSSRFKIKKRIIVGNVSKFIPVDRREENDQPTHKWMVYVRGPAEEPDISHFVQKIWFFLHPSYRPNDLVEVSQPPFHLTRRGWGEFPLRVQLHFKDQRNKRLDIIHQLKLDRTYTGLQTLGAETVVEIELERERKSEKPVSSVISFGRMSSSMCSEVDEEVNLTIKEQQSPNKVQSMPLLAEHLLGKIPTNENSNMSVLSDKENLYGESSCDRKTSESGSSINLSEMILGSKGNLHIGQKVVNLSKIQTGQKLCNPSHIRMNSVISPSKSTISVGSTHSIVNVPGSTQGISISQASIMVKTTPTSTKLSSGQLVLQTKQTTQPTLILATSSHNKCITTSQSTITNSVAMDTVSTMTTTSHTSSVVSSAVSGTEQTLYVRCSDNQGNVFLVPHHLLKHLPSTASGAKITSQTTTKSENSTSGTSPLKIGLAASNTKFSAQTTTSVNTTPKSTVAMETSQSKVLVQTKGGSITQTTSNKEKSQIILSLGGSLMNPSVQGQMKKSPAGQGQSGSAPVLLIRTDQPIRNPNLVSSLVTKSVGSVNQGQRQINPVKLQLQGNIVQPVLNVRVQGQVTQKPQSSLKVTSEGLKSVEQKTFLENGNVNISCVNKSAAKSESGKINKACHLASLLTGEISLANRNPVQVLGSGKSVVMTTSQSDKCTVSSKSLQQSINGTISINSSPKQGQDSLSTHSSILGKQFVSQNVKSLLKSTSLPSTFSQTVSDSKTTLSCTPSKCGPKVVTSSTQSKTVLAKIGNQTLILQLPIPDTACDKEVKGEGQKQTVTLNLKPESQGQSSLTSAVKSSVFSVPSSTLTQSPSMQSVSQQTATQLGASLTTNSLHHKVLQGKLEQPSTSSVSMLSNEEEKCILNCKKKRNLPPPPMTFIKVIEPVEVADYPDMASMVKAAVIRHPIVSETADRSQHPYCAKDIDQWLNWNVGKRRSSEWQRALTCRRFLKKCIGKEELCQGRKLWSTKQILVWCRLHAYSPHYLEKPLYPSGAELTIPDSKGKGSMWFSTASNSEKMSIPSMSGVTTQSDDDSDVDIICLSKDLPKVKVKVEKPDPEPYLESHTVIEADEEDQFVQSTARKIGVIFEPSYVTDDVVGPAAEKLLYTAMKCFASDLIQEAFALKVNQGRYPDGLGVTDIYHALSAVTHADFITNKHLGAAENKQK